MGLFSHDINFVGWTDGYSDCWVGVVDRDETKLVCVNFLYILMWIFELTCVYFI